MAATFPVQVVLEATDRASREIIRALRNIDRATDAFEDADDAAKGLGNSAEESEDKVGAVGRAAQFTAAALAAATAAAVGLGVKGVQAATDFQSGMANVDTLLGGMPERLDELSDSVKDISVQTGKPLDDVTDGLYQVVSAFGDSADSADILRINAEGATAGLATTEQAIALTSAVTKAWGDTSAEAVQQASDLAFVAVKLGQTDFPQLAGAMGNVTSTAVSMGVSQEELFASFAATTGVIGGASEVSTKMRAALLALQSPTAAMSGLLEEMGLASGEALIEQEGLAGALSAVVQAAEDSNQPLSDFIGSAEGMAFAQSLAGAQSEAFTSALEEMGSAAGATSEAFEIQQGTVENMQARVAAAGRVILVTLGEKLLPLLETVLTWVVDNLPVILDTFDGVFNGIGQAVETVAGVFDFFGGVVSDFAAGFEEDMRSNEEVARDVFGGMESASTGAQGIMGSAFTAISGFLAQFSDTFEAAATFFATLWEKVLRPTLEAMAPLFSSVFRAIGIILKTAFDALGLILEGFTAFLNGDWTEGFRLMQEAVSTIFSGLVRAVVSILGGLVSSLFELGKNIMQGLIDGVVSYIQFVRDAISTVFDNVVSWFKNLFGIASPSSVFTEFGTNIIQGLIDGITSMITGVGTAITDLATSIIGTFTDAVNPQKFIEFGAGVVNGFVDGIGRTLNNAKSAVEGFAGNVGGWFKDTLGIDSPSKVFRGYGTDVVEGFIAGVEAESNSAEITMQLLADQVEDAARTSMPPGFLASVGTQLVLGLNQGIRDAVETTEATVALWTARLVEAAQVALGLKESPTEWHAMGQALAQGILDGFNEVIPDFEARLARAMMIARIVSGVNLSGAQEDGTGFDTPGSLFQPKNVRGLGLTPTPGPVDPRFFGPTVTGIGAPTQQEVIAAIETGVTKGIRDISPVLRDYLNDTINASTGMLGNALTRIFAPEPKRPGPRPHQLELMGPRDIDAIDPTEWWDAFKDGWDEEAKGWWDQFPTMADTFDRSAAIIESMSESAGVFRGAADRIVGADATGFVGAGATGDTRTGQVVADDLEDALGRALRSWEERVVEPFDRSARLIADSDLGPGGIVDPVAAGFVAADPPGGITDPRGLDELFRRGAQTFGEQFTADLNQSIPRLTEAIEPNEPAYRAIFRPLAELHARIIGGTMDDFVVDLPRAITPAIEDAEIDIPDVIGTDQETKGLLEGAMTTMGGIARLEAVIATMPENVRHEMEHWSEGFRNDSAPGWWDQFTNRVGMVPRPGLGGTGFLGPLRPGPATVPLLPVGGKASTLDPKIDHLGRSIDAAGDILLGFAVQKIPLVGTALEGFAAGPIAGVVAIFTELIGRSTAFTDLIKLVNVALEPVIAAAGEVVTALLPLIEPLLALVPTIVPLIQIIARVLTPVMSVLGTVMTGVGHVITGIIGALVSVWNFLVGWIPGMRIDPPTFEVPELPTDTLDSPRADDRRDEEQRRREDISFHAVAPTVQLAVATPLMEAAGLMLQAAHLQLNAAGGTGLDDQQTDATLGHTAAMVQHSGALERHTAVLNRLLSGTVDSGGTSGLRRSLVGA